MWRLSGKAAGLLSLFAITGPAFAADMPVERQRPQQTERAPAQQQSNWSGTQVGGFNGGSSVSNGFAEPGSNLFFPCIAGTGTGGCTPALLPGLAPDVETPFGFDKDKVSFTFGGFLGYRWQFGSFVAGIEGDAAYKRGESNESLTVSSRASYHTSLTAPPFETALRSEQFYGQSIQTWDASARARLGFLITPSVLVYGTGGVAFGEVKGSYTYSAVSNLYTAPAGLLDLTHMATVSGSWSETRVGWTGGGGVEMAVWGPWKARLEYRYSDLGTFTKSVPLTRTCADAGSGPATCTNAPNVGTSSASIDIKSTFQTFRVGLGFDF